MARAQRQLGFEQTRLFDDVRLGELQHLRIVAEKAHRMKAGKWLGLCVVKLLTGILVW